MNVITNLFWWRKRKARKAEEDRKRAEAIAEHIAVRRPVHRMDRAPKLKPVVKHLPRRWDDDPSLPSSEVSWTPVNVEPPTITYSDPSPPSDPAPSTISAGGARRAAAARAGLIDDRLSGHRAWPSARRRFPDGIVGAEIRRQAVRQRRREASWPARRDRRRPGPRRLDLWIFAQRQDRYTKELKLRTPVLKRGGRKVNKAECQSGALPVGSPELPFLFSLAAPSSSRRRGPLLLLMF